MGLPLLVGVAKVDLNCPAGLITIGRLWIGVVEVIHGGPSKTSFRLNG